MTAPSTTRRKFELLGQRAAVPVANELESKQRQSNVKTKNGTHRVRITLTRNIVGKMKMRIKIYAYIYIYIYTQKSTAIRYNFLVSVYVSIATT